ncbi:MAG: hypothetical protein MZU97_05365 [Bacillus subtilis]|nr:hypothetical protein [Bacillus subtilis]
MDTLLVRALYRFVWMDEIMARDALQLPKKAIAEALDRLTSKGRGS